MTSAQEMTPIPLSEPVYSAGELLGEQYRVLRRLSSGGASRVFLCRDMLSSKDSGGSNDLVVLKILPPHLSGNETATRRFEREIELSSRLSHPAIVKTKGTLRINGLPAYAMEYVEGGALSDRLKSSEPLSLLESLEILIRVCSALHALHGRGIIHQDLKPANILLTRDRRPKISDFGISYDMYSPYSIHDSRVHGTAHYISPEYLLEGKVDARSDVFAVGVMAYQMLTGHIPFEGKNLFETIALRFKASTVPAHKVNKNCPRTLSKVIAVAMALDPNKRFQSAQDLHQALLRVFKSRSAGGIRAFFRRLRKA